MGMQHLSEHSRNRTQAFILRDFHWKLTETTSLWFVLETYQYSKGVVMLIENEMILNKRAHCSDFLSNAICSLSNIIILTS